MSVESLFLKSSEGLLTLLGVESVGPVTVGKIVDRFDSFSDLLAASEDEVKGVLNDRQRRNIQEDGAGLSRAYDAAMRQTETAESYEVQMLCVYDEAYPARLRDDPSPPLVVFCGGDMSQLDSSVSAVGTRNPTEWGRRVAYSMARAMADEGWRVVSGLAHGVDAECHRAALDAGVPTAAVLGCGIDMVDPVRDRGRFEFLDRIVGEGGLVVTEQPFGTPPGENTLIRRNRIITALSMATFFMQGEMSGGSMHSVKYALQQGRPIYVPAISAAQLSDTLNAAASNLGRLTPEDLLALLDPPKGKLRNVLESLPQRPVASPVSGRADYPRVLRELEDMLAGSCVEMKLAV